MRSYPSPTHIVRINIPISHLDFDKRVQEAQISHDGTRVGIYVYGKCRSISIKNVTILACGVMYLE